MKYDVKVTTFIEKGNSVSNFRCCIDKYEHLERIVKGIVNEFKADLCSIVIDKMLNNRSFIRLDLGDGIIMIVENLKNLEYLK